jgi:hypothetical protein
VTARLAIAALLLIAAIAVTEIAFDLTRGAWE